MVTKPNAPDTNVEADADVEADAETLQTLKAWGANPKYAHNRPLPLPKFSNPDEQTYTKEIIQRVQTLLSLQEGEDIEAAIKYIGLRNKAFADNLDKVLDRFQHADPASANAQISLEIIDRDLRKLENMLPPETPDNLRVPFQEAMQRWGAEVDVAHDRLAAILTGGR